MTWTKVGADAGSTNGFSSWSNTTLSDLRICEVINFTNKTVWATALSAGGCTWSFVGNKLGVTNSYAASLFLGTISATGTQTASITWSGTAPTSWGYASQMFHSTVGSWFVDKQGNIDQGAGFSAWVSLTPSASGGLYWGYAANGTTAQQGTTSGYLWNASIDSVNNGCAYNLNCAGGTATNPVWGDTNERFGMMAVLLEGSAATGRGQSRSRLYIPGPRRTRAHATYGR